eukprot:3430028-Pyramimonas_sp.AAC.1
MLGIPRECEKVPGNAKNCKGNAAVYPREWRHVLGNARASYGKSGQGLVQEMLGSSCNISRMS